MRKLYFLFLVLCSISASAQSIFQRVFDCNVGDVRAMATTNGGTYVAYDIYDDEFGYRRGIGVVKYGPDHQPLWNNVYTAFSPAVNLVLYDIVATTDGGVVFAGVKNEMLRDTALVVKVSGSGQVLWSVAMPSYLPAGAVVGSDAEVIAMAQAPNGDLLVAGNYGYFVDDLFIRAFVARISASGTVLWTKSYVSSVDPDHINRAYDVAALPGGGIALLGNTSEDGSWLARLQDDGTVAWCKRYSTMNGFDQLAPMSAFPTTAGFDIFLQPDPYTGNLACVMHTNGTGAVQSTTLYKVPVGHGFLLGATQLPGQGYAVASSTNLTGGIETGNAHLLVLGADHTIQLSASFGVAAEHEYARDVVPMPDGGYLLGGGAAYVNLDDHRGGTPPRPYVVKTDAQGTYTCGDPVQVTVADTTLTAVDRTLVVEPISGWASATLTSAPWLVSVTVCSVVGVEETVAPTFSVLPNPATDQLVVLPTGMAMWDHVLLDATGRTVRMQQRTTGRLQWDVSTLAPGWYTLRSQSGDAVRSTTVLVTHQ